MAPKTHLFVFGDQTAPVVPKLLELLAVRDCPILVAFLEQSHYVLRAQIIRSLPPSEHKAQRTADLAELVQRYAHGQLNAAFQTALSCLCNLGLFIR
jgi:noranthrone synthase